MAWKGKIILWYSADNFLFSIIEYNHEVIEFCSDRYYKPSYVFNCRCGAIGRKGKLETTRSLYSQTPVSRQSEAENFFGSTNWSKNLVDY